jgi:hypothetical protein
MGFDSWEALGCGKPQEVANYAAIRASKILFSDGKLCSRTLIDVKTNVLLE